MVERKKPQGMILAAGLGTRLRPLTLSRPKPLMEVMGQPLISFVLSHMRRAGVSQIVINTHYLGRILMDALGDSFYGIPIRFNEEKKILGTGGGLKNVFHILEPSDPVLLMNGDIFIDLDCAALFAAHKEKKAFATLMLKTVPDPHIWGAVGTDGNDQIQTLVKHIPYAGPPLLERMFCGTHLLSPEIWGHFPKEDAFSIIDAFYAPLIQKQKRIFGLEQKGFYSDIGTPEALFKINMDLLNQKVEFASQNFFAGFSQISDGVWCGRNTKISSAAQLLGPVLLDDEAEIQAGAQVGPSVIIGKRAVVGKKAEVRSSIVMSDTMIPAHRVCDQMILDGEQSVQISNTI